MIVGTSQVDITPPPGSELSGFAARVQPSTGVLDRLFARALYLVADDHKVLWVHCDLIGFDRESVQVFRQWAGQVFGLRENQVLLSATHTHAGPCTIHLREAGEYDSAYVAFLLTRLREATHSAMARLQSCELVAVEGRAELAIDRRKTASSHTDPRVAALGFRCNDGTFASVIVNYPIHPVALGPNNRMVSADISGQTASILQEQLPGNPVVLVTNGACANLNPPAENVNFSQVTQWGGIIANAVCGLLKTGASDPGAKLRTLTRQVPLPREILDVDGINKFADRALNDRGPLEQWGDKYVRVVEHWRKYLLKNGNGQNEIGPEAELFGLQIGSIILLGVNAEVFSRFTDMLRENVHDKVYLLGYANGDMGYLPTLAAYSEGGYEVDIAHLFYGGFRFKAGGLELLMTSASDLLQQLEKGPEDRADRDGDSKSRVAAEAQK